MIPFEGFTHLEANFLYCPNQFLDVCVPNCSRSVVRLVAFFLDQTLGWLDQEGNPINQHITISYRQLIKSAGISNGAIRTALDEAIAAGFIVCLREGRSATTGDAGDSAIYALRWDEQGEYQDDPVNFQGFYAGNGHRTPIPNAFFRHVIPNEPLVVTKVVAAVLRHTVGYQNQFGGRRSQAPLAYRFIQEYANIPNASSLSQAISSAIVSKYIVCVEKGRFDNDPTYRKPAMYAVYWQQNQKMSVGAPKNGADERSNFRSRGAVQKTEQDRSNKGSSSAPKNGADERSRIQSKEKTLPKDTLKQQHDETVVVMSKGFKMLRDAGFDEPTARRLASVASEEQINQQIRWLPGRNPDQNRLGMLRRAIEENWSAPDRFQDIKSVLRERREKDEERAFAEARENARLLAEKQQRVRQKSELQALWDGLSSDEQLQIEKQAYQNLPGEMLRHLFLTKENHRLRACLAELNRQLTAEDRSKSS